MRIALLLATCVLSIPVAAQSPTRILDINPSGSSISADPGVVFSHGGITYFMADDGVDGGEIWRTDGTASGTWMLKDINPSGSSGSMSSVPMSYYSIGSQFLLGTPFGLWVSDGTTAGTQELSSTAQSPQEFVDYNGDVYFNADHHGYGTELWKTDGTPGGTVLTVDVQQGATDTRVSSLAVLGGFLYFVGRSSTGGVALYRSDGTPAGTTQVVEFRSNGGGGFESTQGVVTNGRYIFGVDGGSDDDVEPWTTDGTVSGTQQLVDAYSGSTGSFPSDFILHGGYVYFTAESDTNGRELWKSDGTPSGTAVLKDVSPGLSGSSPEVLGVVGGEILFSATNGTYGREIWKTDGTSAGTVLVRDIYTGFWDGVARGAFVHNGQVYFAGNDSVNGTELWRTDGTAAGTVLMSDTVVGSGHGLYSWDETTVRVNRFGVTGSNLVFFPQDASGDREPWVVSTTVAGSPGGGGSGGIPYASPNASMVKDINPGFESSISFFSNFSFDVPALGLVFFAADDGTHGEELWATDGTTSGTSMVKDINPTGGSSPKLIPPTNVYNAVYFDGQFFLADDGTGTTGRELWFSDGTAAGTYLVKDIVSGPGDSSISRMYAWDGWYYFSVYDGVHGSELWRTDGTSAGTSLVKDINPGIGSGSSHPGGLTACSGYLWFCAEDGVHGRELWRSDGTAAGTQMFLDLNAGSGDGCGNRLSIFNGRLYFSAQTSTTSLQLWSTDGTVAGTSAVAPASGHSNPSTRIPQRGFLYFLADDTSSSLELWRTDGTASGTIQLTSISIGGTFAIAQGEGNDIYLGVDDGVHGNELWKSDGTLAGTGLFADIVPGEASGKTPPIVVYSKYGRLLVLAHYASLGREFWILDGANGLVLYQDILPGAGSGATIAREVNGRLLFIGTDGVHGREIWSIDLPPPPVGSGFPPEADVAVVSSLSGPTNGPFEVTVPAGAALADVTIELLDPEYDDITVTSIVPPSNVPGGVTAPAIPSPGHLLSLTWNGTVDGQTPVGSYTWTVNFEDAVNQTPVSVDVTIIVDPPVPGTGSAPQAEAPAGSSLSGPVDGPFEVTVPASTALSNVTIELTDTESDEVTVTSIVPPASVPVGVTTPAVPAPGHPLSLTWSGTVDAQTATGPCTWAVTFEDNVNQIPVSVDVTIIVDPLPPGYGSPAQAEVPAGSSLSGPINGPFEITLQPGATLTDATIELTDPDSDEIAVTSIIPPGTALGGVTTPVIPAPGHPLTLTWNGFVDSQASAGAYTWTVTFEDAINQTPVSIDVTINIDAPAEDGPGETDSSGDSGCSVNADGGALLIYLLVVLAAVVSVCAFRKRTD